MKNVKKKFVALLSAAALVLPVAAAPAINAVAEETFAFLRFAAADWGVQTWDGVDEDGVSVRNAPVNGNGTYTVGLDFDEPVDGFAFFNVEIADGTSLYPAAMMTIDEIRINGEAIEFGDTYTSDEDGNTRVNLYNEWVDAIPDDARFDSSAASPTPVDSGLTGISSIDVTFTLEVPVATVEILYAASDWGVQFWGGDADSGVTANSTVVEGDGTYTVSLEFDPPGSGIAFFAVVINAGQHLFPNKFMQIDSVLINGEEVEVGNTYSNYEGGHLRTNLYNEWVDSVTEGITVSGDSDGVTPTPVSADVGDVSSIEVTFTLMDGVAFGYGDDEDDYEVPSAFNAFMMFQDNGGGEWSNFAPGVGNDMMILGDGIWEVSITREQAGGSGQAIPDESGFVFLVDIEGLGRAMEYIGTLWEEDGAGMTGTDAEVSVEIFVDGEPVSGVRNENIKYGDIEGNGRLRLELVNTWGTGTLDNPVAMPSRLNPNDEIKVVFTLKGTGFNSDFDWDAAAAVEDAPAPVVTEPAPVVTPPPADVDDSSDGMNVGIIIAIVAGVVGVAIIVVVFIVSKKKKGSKAEE
ncbi:MAG: hypothetical protein LBC96_02255 [Lachnospiraceae bacterium]|nr:hypothetical protein [Lachnospiraceae bacterium]